MKKFELTTETNVFLGRTLYRIRALRAFSDVDKGEFGGFIEKETNLAHEGDAWVCGDARVSGNAIVSGNAWVLGNARVSGDAWVSGNARVSGDARVYGKAWVSGNARVSGNAGVYGKAEVYGDAWVLGNDIVCGDDEVIGCIHLDHVAAIAYCPLCGEKLPEVEE